MQKGRPRRKGKLGSDQIQPLDAMGFPRDSNRARWERMLTSLINFKNTHGHLNVASNRLEERLLFEWVSEQRKLKELDLLDQTRMKRLEEIGFQWNTEKSD
jgi:hypothetical protein